jgi:hypothetical protein
MPWYSAYQYQGAVLNQKDWEGHCLKLVARCCILQSFVHSCSMLKEILCWMRFGLFCNRQLLVALENCAMYCH